MLLYLYGNFRLKELIMKKLLLLVFAISSIAATAQKDVYMRIMHQWDGQPFAFNTIATTSEGDDVKLSRVQYYISGIKIYHDGGQMTDLATTYILADASDETQVNLGPVNLSVMDSISFAIGVDQSSNHSDPAGYNSFHPLAPKSPSMHWGWTAGYRFAALEGSTGSSMTDPMEVHALGDANYFTQTVVTSGTDMGSYMVVQLDADYIRAFDDISMSSGLINHGETGVSVTLLKNFRDNVYTESQQSVNPVGLDEVLAEEFSLSPNPATVNNAAADFGNPVYGSLRVLDLSGRVVMQQELRGESELKLDVSRPGVYLVEFKTNASRTAQRLIVQ